MITSIEVYQEIPEQDLDCFSIEVFFQLKKSVRYYCSPEVHLTTYIESNNGGVAWELQQKLKKFLEEQKIGYHIQYVDAVTMDYVHLMIASLYPRERVVELISSLDKTSCGTIYEVQQNYESDMRGLANAKEKLKSVLFG